MTKRMELSPGRADERKSRGHQREDASFPVRPSKGEIPASYGAAFAAIKERIRTERQRAVLAANATLVMLYWDIGKTILDRQRQEGWGAKVIDRLSYDLREAFPNMRGLSPRNLKYMRSFATAWPDRQFVQQVAAQIPWFHNVVLLDKIKERLVVEYALRGVNKPMGVAQWETRLVESLPTELKGSLPSVEEIEAELVRHEA